jgi:predicted AlkP superfamily phosphohydrolase/phosphomutase
MKKQLGTYGLLLGLMLALLGAGCARTPKHKVFVLGIDGLTFDLLIPWAQEGKLPHFAQLLEEGSSTQLVSVVPPSSPPAWTSATTGVNPGKHDIFAFIKGVQLDANGQLDLIFYTARDRMADPLWVLLTERERRSVVINVPCTSPPDSVLGIMISGFPHTSSTHFTYPPQYRFEIPDYRKDVYGQVVSVAGEDDFLREMDEIMDQRVKVAFKLLEEEPWELFFLVFTITDRVQHYFWKFMDPRHPLWSPEKAQLYGDAILKTYQRMDEFLGQLRLKLDSHTTLVVMSDHGFGPVYQPINGQNFIDSFNPSGDFRVISADQFGAKFYLTPPKNSPNDQSTQEAYVQTKEMLKRELEQLRDPDTGQRVIQRVFEKTDLYWGPYAHRAPALQGLESNGYLFWNWNPTKDKGLFVQRDDPVFSRFFSAYHRLNGILIMAGSNVRRGANNFDAQIFDIAPTVLYLMNEPIPNEMDGKILKAPISQDYLASHALDARWTRPIKVRQMEGLADSTEAINRYIEEQLRAIGYVQ